MRALHSVSSELIIMDLSECHEIRDGLCDVLRHTSKLKEISLHGVAKWEMPYALKTLVKSCARRSLRFVLLSLYLVFNNATGAFSFESLTIN